MAANPSDPRVAQGNKVLDALKAETDRGKACVADAMLDDLFKQLFEARLIEDDKAVAGLVSDGRPLGSHGVRLNAARALGWIGPELHHDCSTIHRIRNKMAHEIDVDSFDHEAVRDLVDNLKSSRKVPVTVRGENTHVNLKRRQDRFLAAAMFSMLRCWKLLEVSRHSKEPPDPPIQNHP